MVAGGAGSPVILVRGPQCERERLRWTRRDRLEVEAETEFGKRIAVGDAPGVLVFLGFSCIFGVGAGFGGMLVEPCKLALDSVLEEHVPGLDAIESRCVGSDGAARHCHDR